MAKHCVDRVSKTIDQIKLNVCMSSRTTNDKTVEKRRVKKKRRHRRKAGDRIFKLFQFSCIGCKLISKVCDRMQRQESANKSCRHKTHTHKVQKKIIGIRESSSAAKLNWITSKVIELTASMKVHAIETQNNSYRWNEKLNFFSFFIRRCSFLYFFREWENKWSSGPEITQ